MKFNVSKLRRNAIVVLASLSMAATSTQALRFTSLSTVFKGIEVPFKILAGIACLIGGNQMQQDNKSDLAGTLYTVAGVNLLDGVSSIPGFVQSWQTNNVLNEADKKKKIEKQFGVFPQAPYSGAPIMPNAYMQNMVGQPNMNVQNMTGQPNMNMGNYSMPINAQGNFNVGNQGAYLNPNAQLIK